MWAALTATVAVVGPALSGVTAVLTALNAELPDISFVGSEAGANKLSAVVFVVSASAHLVGSDCEILDRAARGVDSVVAVVSKIDTHRNWREVLAANQSALAAHSGRYDAVRWLGVAAAPALCVPVVQPLVDVLREVLADPTLSKRNQLRRAEAELVVRIAQLSDDVDRPSREAEILRRRRAEIVRARRQASVDQASTARRRVHELRMHLGAYVRRRCIAVRAELSQKASTVTRRQVRSFPDDVARDVRRTIDEIGAEVRRQLGSDACVPGESVEVAPPPLPRRLEGRLAALLGAGFGLGVAVSVGRFLVQLIPGWHAAALATGVCLGIGLTTWVIGTRNLLQQRLMFERWIGEVVAALRAQVEDQLAAGVLAAEYAMTDAAARLHTAETQRFDDVVVAMDRDIRLLMTRSARASAYRERQVVAMQGELAEIRAEFGRI